MANALDLAIRITGKDAGARAALQGVANEADALSVAVSDAASKSDVLRGKLEGFRNAGAGLAAAGAGGIMLANSLIQVSNEGERAQAKLDAMFNRRGEGGRVEELSSWAQKLAHDMALVDDDPIKEASAGLAGFGMSANQVKAIMPGLIGQSRLYNQSLESVSEAVGRAFGKGDIDALARIGVTLSDADKALMKSMDSAPLVERQRVAMQLLQKSFSQYALTATEGMSEAEVAANRAALAMDTLQSSIGKGAADAKKNMDGLLAGVLGLVSASPQAAEGAGAILAHGSYAATSVGSVIALASQVGMATMGLKAMGITAVPTFATITAGATAAAIPLALIGITLAALVVAFKGTQDAGTMSAESLRAKWGPLAEIWIRGGDALEGIAATLMGINNQKAGDAAERATYELDKKSRAKHGKPALTFEQWKSGNGVGSGAETMPGAPSAPFTSSAAAFGGGASAAMPDFNAMMAAATASATVADAPATATTTVAKEVKAAQREAKKAARDTERKAAKEKRESIKAERKAQRDAMKQARDAQREANKEQAEARREQLWALADEHKARIAHIDEQRRANKITADRARDLKAAANREYELSKREIARGGKGGALGLAASAGAAGAKWGGMKGVSYGTGMVSEQDRIRRIIDAAAKEKDPAQRAYLLRGAGSIMDNARGPQGTVTGGRTISVGNRQETLANGSIKVMFEPIVIAQPSLTGRF